MKAPEFIYKRPETLEAALALLAEHGDEAQPLAGGQSLMPMMNFRLAAPEVLVDLGAIAALRGIEDQGDHIRLGAMTRYSDLAAWAPLPDRLALVARALPHIAHTAIRNRGTVGGSLSLADPAAELPAIALAMEATMELTGQGGARQVPAADYFHGFYETAREDSELLTAIRLPTADDLKTGFYELAPRHGDYAVAGVALTCSGTNPVTDLRAAFFGIAGAALRLPDIEAAFEGKAPDDPDAAAAARAALAAEDILSDTKASAAYRRHVALVVLRRALEGAA